MNWPKWRKAVLGTLGAIGIWIAAVIAVQPAVPAVPLPLKQIGDARWVYTNTYETIILGYHITILPGFKTDLASIGRVLQEPLGIKRDAPTIRRGAGIHDALYASRLLPKDVADKILYQACIEDGMDKDKANAVLTAVNLWGFTAWDRHNGQSVIDAKRLVKVNVVR